MQEKPRSSPHFMLALGYFTDSFGFHEFGQARNGTEGTAALGFALPVLKALQTDFVPTTVFALAQRCCPPLSDVLFPKLFAGCAHIARHD